MVGALGSGEVDDFTTRVQTRVASPGRVAAVRDTGLLDTGAEPAFDRIAALTARLLGTPMAFVTLADDRHSFWKACIGIDVADPADRRHDVHESLCQYIIGLDDMLLVDDILLDPRMIADPSMHTMDVRAWAGAPLRDRSGAVLGTVCAADTRPRQWSDDDRRTLADLAAIGADEMAARAATLAALRAEALLAAIVERAPVGFCLVDDDLRFEMVNSVLATSNGRSVEAHLGRRVSDILSSDARPIIDAMRSIVEGRADALEVDLQGEVPGQPGRRQAFHASYFRVDLGDGTPRVAALVSDETEHAMSRRRAEILAELTRRLAVADDLAAVARAIDDLAGDYIGARMVTVALVDAAHRHLEIVTARSRLLPTGAHLIPVTGGPVADALAGRDLVVVESCADHRSRHPGSEPDLLTEGSAASLVAPMRTGSGRPIGVVAFGWPRTIERDELPRRQIDTLVDVITQAIERIRASSQRRALVSGLQQIVLATPETRPGLDVAVRYIPAATSLGFGGDWYDVVPIDDSDRTALIVGDVVGHDAAAAVRMTETRAMVRQLLRLDTPLAGLFDRVGELLATKARSALATVAIVVVDPTARTLRASSAGHLPPLVIDPYGRVRRLPLGLGPFLGVTGERRAPVLTPYEPGATVVCYSDGLIESRSGDIDADIDALATELAGGHLASCEDVAAALVDRFVDPGALTDDVALVVARL